jgi:S-adenosylmethionine:tRNA ribosyltransferase-isomerase
MHTAELDYDLPESLIAQHPAPNRSDSRLLVLHREQKIWEPVIFRELPRFLRPGDCLVMNNTRVIRARLRAAKETGARVELFLLHDRGNGNWQALVRPSRKLPPGSRVFLTRLGSSEILQPKIEVLIGARLDDEEGGGREITFGTPDVLGLLAQTGEIPLPPYIHRDKPRDEDVERYQTVYAQEPGAVAAPTAGLHFTPELLEELQGMGVGLAHVTLHVGYGTFKPISADRIEDHTLEAEDYLFTTDTARLLADTRASGGRIISVGTTSTRVLESCCANGRFEPGEGQTRHYIYPPYTFRAADALITNFHLPKSSLLALVSAFAGHDFVMDAYRFAIEQKFRFYSYGDAMLVL